MDSSESDGHASQGAPESQLSITKLDAARRQLETAIRLYFHHGDPVSIHTLTEAAYEIITALNRKRGGRMLFKELLPSAVEKVLPEKAEEFKKSLSEAKNFFKHADRDPEKTLTFSPALAEILLYEATEKYTELTDEVIPAFAVFRIWFVRLVGPKVLSPEDVAELAKVRIPDEILESRERFYETFLPIAGKLGPSG